MIAPVTRVDEPDTVQVRSFDPDRRSADNAVMSVQEVDAYLAALEEPKRSTLTQLRDTILGIVPNAEQCISYGVPAFRLGGKTVAGFAAFKNHLSYLPHSGSVLPALSAEVAGFTGTKSALHFPVDKALPAVLVRRLLDARMGETSAGSRWRRSAP